MARDLEIWNLVVDHDIEGLSVRQIALVEAFAEELGMMNDDELFAACCSAIYNAALVSRSRGAFEDYAKCTLCFNEARRRDPDTGAAHRGASVYARAHDAVMRGQGHR